ncbi:DUF1207 domain-containing protein [Botrimarina hoheduenensis]|uniref:DUF1207 domain-containing protein n=1 Tax=Botrimarina hoheduenensis TaxID=2528000 RepID=A0A5C5WC98_9BACT|nr:DUF1207 domain-containing protein [Botrimarina hoheduenensis]TWT47685.1 hypothetical protein Pla111_13040 [Botrimarina hoheduenensis]
MKLTNHRVAKRTPLLAGMWRHVAAVVGLFCLIGLTAGAAAQSAADPFLVASQASLTTAYNDPAAIRLASLGAPIGEPVTTSVVDYPSYSPTQADPLALSGYAGGYAGGYNTEYTMGTGGWRWELMPDGLIYRSYQAGPRESRLGLHTIHTENPINRSEWLWDATLGGRKGVLRFGNGDPTDPRGWQLDLEGATTVRLNLDENRDVDSSDFRFGVPITYTSDGILKYKVGYYHVSSHLGDELITRTGVNSRINYVRDAIIAGVSYNVTPSVRLYGETAYAFFTAGGAEPWEFQFGAEWSAPGPTDIYGTPFLATNAHLREEIDFGGDWTLQTGWLWRGETGSTLRLGLHYMNGKSTQYQFFDRNEEQVGIGLWCDF